MVQQLLQRLAAKTTPLSSPVTFQSIIRLQEPEGETAETFALCENIRGQGETVNRTAGDLSYRVLDEYTVAGGAGRGGTSSRGARGQVLRL